MVDEWSINRHASSLQAPAKQAGAAGAAASEAHRIARRFYLALALTDLILEVRWFMIYGM